MSGENGTYSRRDALRFGAIGAGVAAFAAACGTGGGSGPKDPVTIASGFGISYAPFTIIQAKGWLDQALKGRQVKWTMLSGGSANRDAMLAGKVQIGTSGLGPFLISADSGVPWKIVSGLNDMPLWLVAKDPKYTSLKSFGPNDKIAAVQPGSIQSVMLQKAAQQQLGNPHALDKNIATMEHPEALQALIGGQIAAAYTSPPFQFQAIEQGARKLVDSYDLFGQHGFNVVTATEDYAKDNGDVLAAVYAQVDRANKFIKANPAEAAKIISKAENGKISAEKYEKYLTWKGIDFTTAPHSIVKLGTFMHQIGVIKKAPGPWTSYVFDTATKTDGS